MRIVNISPHYHVKGGSDSYFLAQTKLMEQNGIDVAPFCVESKENFDTPWKSYFTPGINLEKPSAKDIINYCYSFPAKRNIRALTKEFKPDLAHLHIFYGNFTSSILNVLKDDGIPIVQTVHDYKPVCPVYSLTREGKTCEDCQGKHFWKALPRRCNKNSFSRSLVSVAESYISKAAGNISKIDRFIAVSNFQAGRLRALGLPEDRMRVIHNYIDAEPLKAQITPPNKPQFLYFGRIERSKGVFDIIEVAKKLPEIQFILAGTGNYVTEVTNTIKDQQIKNVSVPGFVGGESLHELIRTCTATILIPTVYENCPMSVLESLALGVPVIGSKMGGIPELVSHDSDGIIITPGNTDELRAAIEKLATSPKTTHEMGISGRKKILRDFTAEKHFHETLSVYEELDVKL